MCYEKVENGTFQSGVLLGPKDSQRLVLIPLAFFGSFTVFPFKGIFIFDCIHASTPMLLENTPHHKGATTMSRQCLGFCPKNLMIRPVLFSSSSLIGQTSTISVIEATTLKVLLFTRICAYNAKC